MDWALTRKPVSGSSARSAVRQGVAAGRRSCGLLGRDASFDADDVLELPESDDPESLDELESPDADTEPERESVR